MLLNLSITNYELIDHIDQKFYSGLNVITGETGTGKSMILSALGLLGGSRANDRVHKDQSKKCVLEAEFKSHEALKSVFEESNLDFDQQIIIRREFNQQGRSRAFVNDSPVTLEVLKSISVQLLEVHTQDQTNLINDNEYQLSMIDTFAGTNENLQRYQKIFHDFEVISLEIKKKKEQIKKDKEEYDFIQYQFNELSEANLVKGELTALESEKEMLSKEDEIRIALESTSYLLGEQENNSIEQIYTLLNKFEYVKNVAPWIEEIHRRLKELYTELKDLNFEVESRKDNLEMNPGRLTEVEDRLHTYYGLENKFKVQGDVALLELMESFRERLESIEYGDADLEKLELKREKCREELFEIGAELSEERKKYSLVFAEEIIEKLKLLGIKHPKIQFECIDLDEPALHGLLDVRLLFSSNKDQKERRVEEVASGGEKSRLMLAMKSILGRKRRINTMVFDEIDTGISGEVAIKTGELMAELGKNNQVISITHLPQVASKGKHHFKVEKRVENKRTNVSMIPLEEAQRVEELAEMLGGKNISESARKTAEQLLN